MRNHFETIVVGGGQAGLSISYLQNYDERAPFSIIENEWRRATPAFEAALTSTNDPISTREVVRPAAIVPCHKSTVAWATMHLGRAAQQRSLNWLVQIANFDRIASKDPDVSNQPSAHRAQP